MMLRGVVALAACAHASAAVSEATSIYTPPESNAFHKLRGSGTTNPSKYLWEVFDTLFMNSPRPIKMTYDATGSSTGKKNFLNNELFFAGGNDFGCSELAVTTTEENTLKSSTATDATTAKMLHIPFVLGAISIFHSVPDVPTLQLSQDTLAKVFQATITKWNDPAILSDNPNVNLPDETIVVLHRTKGSSSTSLMSEYISKTSTAGVWTLGTGSTLTWPTATTAVSGSSGMTLKLKSKKYAIGYLDSGHGRAEGIAEVSLKNKDGKWVTAKDLGDAGIANAASAVTNLPASHDDWSGVSLVNQAGPNTWPIVTFSYFIVREDLKSLGEKSVLLKQMISFALSAEGQKLVTKYHFVAVPANVVTINTAGMGLITTAPDACPNGDDTLANSFPLDEHSDTKKLKVYASGTTNPKKLHWDLMKRYTERSKKRFTDVRLMYDAIGSGPGREEFVNPGDYSNGEKIEGIQRPASPTTATTDTGGYSRRWKSELGCAELPLSEAMRTKAGPSLTFPFVLGAISFFVHMPGTVFTSGTVSLKLSPDILAKIFQQQITTWDHTEIKALNTDFNPPAGQQITVVHRIKGSSSTFLSTEYMSKTSTPGVWNLKELVDGTATTNGHGAVVNWPADSTNFFGARGSGKVQSSLQSNLYSIGYLDSGHGNSVSELSEVFIKNKNGQYITSQTTGSIAAAAASATLPASHESWESVSLVNQPGANVWPIATFSYMFVHADLSSKGAKGALIKSYLDFLNTAEARTLGKKYGFVEIPDSVVAKNADGLARIKLASGHSSSDFDPSEPVYHLPLSHSDTTFTKIHGSGTTNPSKYLWSTFDKLQLKSPYPIKTMYDAVGSSTGVANFINHPLYEAGGNDFSCAELAMSSSHYDSFGDTGMMHIPFVLGAISIFHSVPDVPTLQLSQDTLAKVFQATITKWNDPAILSDNPNVNLPDETIVVLHRTKGSSSTSLMSEYISKTSTAGVWTLGTGSTLTWPTATTAVSGSSGMTLKLKSKKYAIGYLDSGHGRAEGIAEVSLKNKDGKWVTAKDLGDAGIANAASAVTNLPASHDDWSGVSLVNQAGPNTWPIVTFSYILVRENLSRLGAKGGLVKAIIEYILSTEGQNHVKDFKFVPVPPNVQAINTAGIQRMLIDGGTSSAHWPFLKPDAEQSLTVYASGTTNPKKLHWDLMQKAEERLKARGKTVYLQYDAIGSGPGREEFVNPGDYSNGEKIEGIQRPASPTTATTDTGGYSRRWKSELGCAELPLSEAMRTKAGPSLTFPFVLGAISFFVHMPGTVFTSGTVSLKLSPDILAKIFQQQITTWDHTEIKALNTDFNPPAGQQITVVHRIKGSSSTFLSTEYMSKTSTPGVWNLKELVDGTATTNGHGAVVNWPADSTNFFGARGSGKVQSSLQSNLYSIGYLDSGHGNSVSELSEVFIKNKNGQYITSQTTGSIAAAAASATLPASHESWESVSLVNQPGANVWPIATFSYMFVHADLSSKGAKGALIKSYLDFLNTAEARTLGKKYGFVEIPDSVVAKNADGLARIKLATPATSFDLSPPNYGACPSATPVPVPVPVPCPSTSTVKFPLELGGFTLETFGDDAKLRTRQAIAEKAGVSVDRVVIKNIRNKRRRLVGTIEFDVEISASDSESVDVGTKASSVTAADMAAKGLSVGSVNAGSVTVARGSSSGSKKGLSDGEVAGVAIGCAAFATIVSYFVFYNMGKTAGLAQSRAGFAKTSSTAVPHDNVEGYLKSSINRIRSKSPVRTDRDIALANQQATQMSQNAEV